MSTYRTAEPSEDDHLCLVCYNAFLPVWNHNWFQCIYEPLPAITISKPPPKISSLQHTLTSQQKARLAFYQSLVKSTRLLGGEILVASAPTKDGDCQEMQAVCLWLPAHQRLHITALSTVYRGGMAVALSRYGIRGIYRIVFLYMRYIEKLYKTAGIMEEECAFVQLLASNTEYRDRRQGYASKLLDWQMQRHWEKNPEVTVCLDTATEKGMKAYLKLGFELKGEIVVDSGTDAAGIMLGKDVGENDEARLKGRELCKDRIMIATKPRA